MDYIVILSANTARVYVGEKRGLSVLGDYCLSLSVFLFLYVFHRLQGGRYTGSVDLDHSCVSSGRDSTARSPTAHCGKVHSHDHCKPSYTY